MKSVVLVIFVYFTLGMAFCCGRECIFTLVGNYYLHNDNYKIALENYGIAIKIHPNKLKALSVDENIYLLCDQLKNSTDNRDFMSILNPENAVGLCGRGIVSYLCDQPYIAMQYFNSVIERDPNCKFAITWRSNSLGALGYEGMAERYGPSPRK